MTRIRDTRVGVRLALAFGLLTVLLVAVVGVGRLGDVDASATPSWTSSGPTTSPATFCR